MQNATVSGTEQTTNATTDRSERGPTSRRQAERGALASPQPADERELIFLLLKEIRQLGRRFDEFAGAFLNAKFPHGKATDRWRGHR